MNDTFENNYFKESITSGVNSLMNSNPFYSDIINSVLNIGCLVFDTEGNIILWNNFLEKLTGYKASETIGRKIWDVQYEIMPEGYQYSELETLIFNYKEFVLKNNSPHLFNKSIRLQINSKAGKRKVIEQKLHYIQQPEFNYIVSIISDVTQQVSLETDLQKLDKNFGEALHFTKTIHYKQIFRSGKYEYISRYVEELLGYTIAEIDKLITGTVDKYIHPDDLDKYKREHLELSSEDFISEYRFRAKNGEYKYLSDYHRLVYNDDNKPEYIIGNIRDITLQKQFEEDLQESREQYKILVENITDLVLKTDEKGFIQYASPNFCKLFNVNEVDVIGKNFAYAVHDEDFDKADIAFEQLMSYPFTCHFEHRAWTHFGWRWLEWSKRAIVDDNNNIMQIIGVGRDITKKKRMESAIQKSENDYRNLFEKINSAIIIVNINSAKVLDANQNACDLLGINKSDFIGNILTDFSIQPQIWQQILDHIKSSAHTFQINAPYISSAGKNLMLEINASKTYFADSDAVLILCNDINKYMDNSR